MILEHVGAPAAKTLIVEDIQLEASAEFFGDASELLEVQAASLAEMHNLTIALARFEHKCITEAAAPELLEEGVKEFFAAAVEKIKEWAKRFMAWLGSMWTRLKDLFVKREDWLKRNEVALQKVTADQLKGLKVKLGKEVMNGNPDSELQGVLSAAENAIEMAKGDIPDAAPEKIKQTIRQRVEGKLKAYDEKKSFMKSAHDSMVGDEAEVELSPSDVKKLIAVALASFRSLDQLKYGKKISDTVIAQADAVARMAAAGKGEDTKQTNARLSVLREVSSEVQQMFAALSSALSAMNGQAMSALVKVASHGKVKAEGEAPAAKNEGTSLLAAFM